MTKTVDEYLERLDAALGAMPYATAREIRAGVEEELRSLDAADADERMRALGDPADIASAAAGTLGEAPAYGPGSPYAPTSPVPATRSTGYVVATGTLIAVGAIVVPVVGWIAGVIMLWCSSAWHRWEKIVATVAPFAVAGLIRLASLLAPEPVVVEPRGSGEFHAPGLEEYSANPFIPSDYDVFWTSLLVLVAANLGAGAWLLLRGLAPQRDRRLREPLGARGALGLIGGLLVLAGLLFSGICVALFAQPLVALLSLVVAAVGAGVLIVRASLTPAGRSI